MAVTDYEWQVVELLTAILKAVGGRVPRTAEQQAAAAAQVPDQKSSVSVSVIGRGRGSRLVPQGDRHPHTFDGDYPTSTTTRERFWKETR